MWRSSGRIPLLFLVLALALPSFAQEEDDEAAAEGRARNFRQTFFQFTEVYGEVMALLGNADRQKAFALAERAMKRTSTREVRQTFGKNPPDLKPLLKAAENLRAVVGEVAASGKRGGAASVGLPGRPGIISECDDILHDSSTVFAFLQVQIAADVALAAANRGCEQVAVALGAGGNASLACLPLDIALTAAKIPFEEGSFCAGEEDSATLQGAYDRLEHVHTDVEAEAESIRQNDNTNRDIILAALATTKAEILAELRALGCELVRLAHTPQGQRTSDILSCTGQPGFPYDFPEKGNGGDDDGDDFVDHVADQSAAGAPTAESRRGPSALLASRAALDAQLLSGRLLPSLYLPATEGGLLEQVRALVRDSLRAHVKLGLAPRDGAAATRLADEADARLARGEYVAAYRSYSQAYRRLVPEP